MKYKRIGAGSDVERIECTNPYTNLWVARWDIQPDPEYTGQVTCMEARFTHKPSAAEVKEAITTWYNEKIDQQIRTGFSWREYSVWLSTENQFNYKAAYDLAVQTVGKSLPVTFKFGTDDAPQYYTFETLEDFSDFYLKSVAYVQRVLAEGWQAKDAIDLTVYDLN